DRACAIALCALVLGGWVLDGGIVFAFEFPGTRAGQLDSETGNERGGTPEGRTVRSFSQTVPGGPGAHHGIPQVAARRVRPGRCADYRIGRAPVGSGNLSIG